MKTNRSIITAIIAILFGAALVTQAEASRRTTTGTPPVQGSTSNLPVVSNP